MSRLRDELTDKCQSLQSLQCDLRIESEWRFQIQEKQENDIKEFQQLRATNLKLREVITF